jgi:hypothetical protein
MENFEPGIRCPWTNYTFSINDRGRKCSRCERVITLSAWQEKQRCFCGSTSLVEAVARTSTPTQILRTTRPQPSPASSSSSNPRETFEPGIRCPWTNYTFSTNDRGRKCSRCERVITLSAWQEKQRCFCGSTSLVEAVARTSTPTQISRTTRPTNSPRVSSNTNVSSLPRATTSRSQSTSSTTSLRQTSSSSSYSPASDSLGSGCSCLALLLLFIMIAFGTCTSQSNQQSRTRTTQAPKTTQPQSNPAQNYLGWNFPRPECGDSNPPGLQNFYPVFVNRTDSSTLQYIKSNYCGDAYLMTRTSVNRKAIQVASFRDKDKAFEFSRIMLRDSRINSAEVGSPSQR